MKKGNQFYLEVQITDENNDLLDILSVKKVQFNINDLTKEYDGINQEVKYDEKNHSFKVYLTESETFNFKDNTKMDARILFKNNTIMGTYIESKYFYESLKEELLDV